MSIKFAICIPTLNEEKYLPILLEALASQTHQNFTVTIADGNSEDKTVPLAESFKNRLPLEIIRTAVRGVSHERNLAARHSSGEHLLFLDADTKPNPDFLETLTRSLEANPVDVATCWNKPLSDSILDRIIFRAYNSLFLSSAVTGTCIYFRRKAFEAVKGFDESMNYGEDGDIVRRSLKAGGSFAVFAEPPIYFSVRRIEKDGRLKYYGRAISWGMYSYLFGKIPKKSQAKYEFGKHL